MSEKIVEKFLNDILQKPNRYLFNSEKINKKIFGYIEYYTTLIKKHDYEEKKHSTLAKILHNYDLIGIELNYSFDSTYLGQLYEVFHWRYDIEYEDSSDKILNQLITDKIDLIQGEEYREVEKKLRFNSIYNQLGNIEAIFNYLSDNIPEIKEEELIILSVIILLDIERMSEIRQKHFVSYYHMEDFNDSSKRWLSSLMIEAKFTEPVIIIGSVNMPVKSDKLKMEKLIVRYD